MTKTKQEKKEVDAEVAFKTNENIKAREQERRKLFILNVCDLVKMYDDQFYKAILGEGVELKWSAYLAQIEVYYTRSQVERWRKIIIRLVKELGMDVNSLIDVPETRLADIADIAQTKEQAEELYDQAKVLIPIDWKNTIAKLKGKPTTDECKHEKAKIYKICSRCGLKIEINVPKD